MGSQARERETKGVEEVLASDVGVMLPTLCRVTRDVWAGNDALYSKRLPQALVRIAQCAVLDLS